MDNTIRLLQMNKILLDNCNTDLGIFGNKYELSHIGYLTDENVNTIKYDIHINNIFNLTDNEVKRIELMIYFMNDLFQELSLQQLLEFIKKNNKHLKSFIQQNLNYIMNKEKTFPYLIECNNNLFYNCLLRIPEIQHITRIILYNKITELFIYTGKWYMKYWEIKNDELALGYYLILNNLFDCNNEIILFFSEDNIKNIIKMTSELKEENDEYFQIYTNQLKIHIFQKLSNYEQKIIDEFNNVLSSYSKKLLREMYDNAYDLIKDSIHSPILDDRISRTISETHHHTE